MKKTGLIFLISCGAILTFCVCAYAFKLPDTGQTKCYATASPWGETLCSSVSGQDGNYNINPMNYNDHGNGTVTDNNTGLMWQKCSYHQNNDTTCSGDAWSYDWYKASGTVDTTHNPLGSFMDICGNLTLASYSDWRLPSKKELMTLVDYSGTTNLSIDTTVFPGTIQNDYWTSTMMASDSSHAWLIYFYTGLLETLDGGDYSRYIRCVRGSQIAQSFADNGETVTDSRTGLMWQKGETSTMNWDAARSYCETSTLDGKSDWRLPNIKELESLAYDYGHDPSIDTYYFPQAKSNGYWSSTTNFLTPGSAWSVSFSAGANVSHGKSMSDFYVRCVRNGDVCSTNPVKIVETSASYPNIQAAYDAAATGRTIQIQENLLSTENLILTADKVISLIGGYDCGFTSRTGYTSVYGSMTIGGTTSITVSDLIIK
jgi:hypothetical protein